MVDSSVHLDDGSMLFEIWMGGKSLHEEVDKTLWRITFLSLRVFLWADYAHSFSSEGHFHWIGNNHSSGFQQIKENHGLLRKKFCSYMYEICGRERGEWYFWVWGSTTLLFPLEVINKWMLFFTSDFKDLCKREIITCRCIQDLIRKQKLCFTH